MYDLAEEAIEQQIERSRSVEAIGSRDDHRQLPAPADNGHNGNDSVQRPAGSGDDEQATEKQINFLLSIGKRQRLSTAKVEAKITEVVGCSVGLYDLIKRQADVVLDDLTGKSKVTTSNRF